MNENQGNDCPGCGTPRRADHTPSCACATLAADALRDAREREVAEAEDFDPLRVRPYVGLGSGTDTPPAGQPRVIVGEIVAARDAEVPLAGPLPPEQPAPVHGAGAGAGAGAAGARVEGAAGPVGPGVGAGAADARAGAFAAAGGPGAAGDPGFADGFGSADGTGSAGFAGPAGSAGSMGSVGSAGAAGPDAAGARGAHRRRRTPKRRVALVTAGSVVGVGAVIAGVTSGLFSYQPPSRTTSLPQRASVPDVDPTEVAAETDLATSAAPSAEPDASASPSTSPSPSSEPSRTPSPTPEPERSSTSAPADGAESDTGLAAGTLSPGDTGPQVAELQRRLAELWLYADEPDGRYDDQVRNSVSAFQYVNGIKGDEYGTYGPHTRAALESVTTGEGRPDHRYNGDDDRRDRDRDGRR
ncbi:peptidoglycan-binding domain-containing protein [Streptomyces sp. NPDC002644]